METQYYTISDFNDILFQNFDYALPDNVLTTIKYLEKNITISFPETVITTNASSNTYKSKTYGMNSNSKSSLLKKKSRNTTDITTEDWTAIRNFKTTKIDTKEGVDKDINDIRISLNKISNINFDSQKDMILKHISDFIDKNTESDTYTADLKRIAQSIFNIASTNKFYSELYADLYIELINRFDVFSTILDDFILTYKDTINNINYVDPNKDYDNFCIYTKNNDRRKATASFVVMLMYRNVLSKDTVIDIIQHFLDVSFQYMSEENRVNEVEEITENVFIFVSIGKKGLCEVDAWNTGILPIIKNISTMKSGDRISLSNRSIFKYLDIVDSVK